MGNLTNLEVLWLSNNQLEGAIPVELADLSNIQHLGLSFDKLTILILSGISLCPAYLGLRALKFA